MAPQPQRREHRKTHLDASVVPVERALLERAITLSRQVIDEPDLTGATEEQAMAAGVLLAVRAHVSAELLALAEELHYW